MKKILRILLLISGLVVGGFLAKLFLTDRGVVGWVLFIAVCVLLGPIFCKIEKIIRDEEEK